MIKKCSQCGLCCSLFLVNLTEKEYQLGKYKTSFEKFDPINDFHKASIYGINTLEQKESGDCIYLEKGKCIIHKDRPQTCKEFFCTSKLKKFKRMIKQIEEKRNSFKKEENKTS